MNRNEENIEDSTNSFLKHPQAEAWGQIQFRQNLIYSKKEKVHVQNNLPM